MMILLLNQDLDKIYQLPLLDDAESPERSEGLEPVLGKKRHDVMSCPVRRGLG